MTYLMHQNKSDLPKPSANAAETGEHVHPESASHPSYLPVTPESIPEEIKTLRQWVGWKAEQRPAKNKKKPSFQRAVHSQSTRVFFGKIFTLFRQFLQETVARHRVLNAIRAAAVLDPDIRAKLKPLVKRSLVSFGHRFVGSPSMRALMTRVVSAPGLRDA
jgi:hypothetical protein